MHLWTMPKLALLSTSRSIRAFCVWANACRGSSQQRLQLGEQLLNRGEVRTIGRKIQNACPGGSDCLSEVVNPSSGRMDRILKVREYAAVPSIRRYVILESTSIGLTVLERAAQDQVWQNTVLTNDDTLRMPEINTDIPVAEIYEGLSFPEQDEASG
jgi:hypothetical protein